ncbi:hypothetical protein EG328_009390 [Venturia inaequalis]|uniref:Transcription elongation factor 1 homolog n=1 Tax=Venturia inaequalis TaxID=5025 RepID=A0A8H3U9W4_VENIN|nr:hypothetical protein EG328_009390 [Venturia inaequalis]KAE9991507.1 hypothetical protein EG327_011527 [Venturia inaequalis]RDI86565.1 hypothetical protein Vi05172_g3402 [Venturia inaequalis]
MGKRKKAAKPASSGKGKENLPTSFQCLFCNHEQSVSVKMDKKSAIGHLSCKVCGQDFDASINYLSHPVDVYGDWIDACDKAAKEAQDQNQPETRNDSYNDVGSRGAPPPRRQRDVPSDDEEDGDGDGEMDDFVENDEGDEEEAY